MAKVDSAMCSNYTLFFPLLSNSKLQEECRVGVCLRTNFAFFIHLAQGSVASSDYAFRFLNILLLADDAQTKAFNKWWQPDQFLSSLIYQSLIH